MAIIGEWIRRLGFLLRRGAREEELRAEADAVDAWTRNVSQAANEVRGLIDGIAGGIVEQDLVAAQAHDDDRPLAAVKFVLFVEGHTERCAIPAFLKLGLILS